MHGTRTSFRLLPPAIATLAIVASLAGCSDTVLSTDLTAPGVAITGQHYIQGSVAGLVHTCQDADGVAVLAEEAYRPNGTRYLESQRVTFVRFDQADAQRRRDPDYQSFEIVFIRNFEMRPSGAERDALVNLGTMSFGSETAMSNGIEIRWTDASGKLWSTALGDADQSGSRFVVSEHALKEADGGFKQGRYFTRGWFTARLYDGRGNSIDIANGRFALPTVWGA
jgi:hypothetical protein